MRIAVVGGRYKNSAQLARIARNAGHEMEFEEGHTHGRRVDAIRAAVLRSDLVVIITDINSHGAVLAAKRLAKQAQRPTLLIENFGVVRLARLLEALERRRQFSEKVSELMTGVA